MALNNVTLRAATADDYPAFEKLFRELADGETFMRYERFCSEILAHTVVADDGGTVIGYAYFRPRKETAHLANVVTAPAMRRKGVGRRLVAEVARRMGALGCSVMTLNVKRTNLAAIRLYESVGLAPVHGNHALRMDWATIDALAPSLVSQVGDARPIDPSEDDALEREHGIARGLFATERPLAGRVLRTISGEGTRGSAKSAVGVFDPGFGGMRAFRAPDLPHAIAILRAVRPFALPDAKTVLLPIENQAALAEALLAVGATLRFETVAMRGPVAM